MKRHAGLEGSDLLLNISLDAVAPESRSYRFTFRNANRLAIVDARFSYSSVLGPGQFGLDDTHMPEDIWPRPPIAFDRLAPGDELSFVVEGYDVPSKFDRPRHYPVEFYCGSENKEVIERRSLVALNVGWPPPSKIPTSTTVPFYRDAFSHRISAILVLGAIGLVVLILMVRPHDR